MDPSSFLQDSREGTVLKVYVQPKASRNEFSGLHQGFLKVRLTAPPVEGEANKECIKFFSKVLGVPKSDIVILQGHKSRQKTLLVRGVAARVVQELLVTQGAL